MWCTWTAIHPRRQASAGLPLAIPFPLGQTAAAVAATAAIGRGVPACWRCSRTLWQPGVHRRRRISFMISSTACTRASACHLFPDLPVAADTPSGDMAGGLCPLGRSLEGRRTWAAAARSATLKACGRACALVSFAGVAPDRSGTTSNRAFGGAGPIRRRRSRSAFPDGAGTVMPASAAVRLPHTRAYPRRGNIPAPAGNTPRSAMAGHAACAAPSWSLQDGHRPA